MITTFQKWMLALVGLGAGYMVLSNPNAFYTATKGVTQLVTKPVVSISTGGKRS